MVPMPQFSALGRIVGTGIKAGRLVVRGSVRGGAWATRRVGLARAKGAANEVGMIRLFDLHAVSCAGDALIAIGLAGTIFSVPLGEARSKVALYLLITMVPFALLAPVVGPLLDHFRHGRRYALATTFLGRAFLAYVMSDNLLGWGLYPAAFGVLALSRAYGVARSAAVPRLLPEGVGLSQVGARASVYGTFAGALVAPIGLLAFKFGPQWPLRVATIIFLVGMVVALRLPPRADSDPPEAMPRPWRTVLGISRDSDRPLSNRLVVATLIGSSSLRLLYGFMLLFLTFAIMGDQLTTEVFGYELGRNMAVGLVGGALALGTFLSTAAGTGLRIRRPLALQSSGLIVTAGVAVLTTILYNLAMVTLLALLTATFSGLAKLAVDASIQERVPERQRATAFAHSETALMLAWVAGGGLGLIPVDGRLGLAFAALLAVLAAARAAWSAARLHNERLAGRPDVPVPDDDPLSGTPTAPDIRGARGGSTDDTTDLRGTPGASPDHTTDLRGTPGASPDDTTDLRRAPGAGGNRRHTAGGGRPGSGTAGTGSGRGAGDRAGTAPDDDPAAWLEADETWTDDPWTAGGDGTRSGSGRGRAGQGAGSRAGRDDRTARPGGTPGRRHPADPPSRDGDTRRLDPEPDGRRWWQRKSKSPAPAGRPVPSGRSDSGRADAGPGGGRPGDLGGRGGDVPGGGRPADIGGRGRGDAGPGGGRPSGIGGRGRGGDVDSAGPPMAPPGYHVYRPSSAGSETRDGDPAENGDS
jgi:MFS family permease